ncbi:2999_t:CDS:2, partial [Dentiscutata erythropus]
FIEGRRFHNVDGVQYPLPNDDEENDRLHTQHFLFRYVWQNNFSSPVDHILSDPNANAQVLDVGCGAGSWTLKMATTYQKANFIGLDMTPHQPLKIKPRNVSFVQANVFGGLPFEDNVFDFIYHRLLFTGYPMAICENGRLGEVAIDNSMCVMRDLKTPLMNTLQVSSEEYDELCKTATEEIRELNSYYPMIRVYA